MKRILAGILAVYFIMMLTSCATKTDTVSSESVSSSERVAGTIMREASSVPEEDYGSAGVTHDNDKVQSTPTEIMQVPAKGDQDLEPLEDFPYDEAAALKDPLAYFAGIVQGTWATPNKDCFVITGGTVAWYNNYFIRDSDYVTYEIVEQLQSANALVTAGLASTEQEALMIPNHPGFFILTLQPVYANVEGAQVTPPQEQIQLIIAMQTLTTTYIDLMDSDSESMYWRVSDLN